MNAPRGVCPGCFADVLWLPTPDGILAFDAAALPSGQVAEADRYVVLPHHLAIRPRDADPPPATCLRRHTCSDPNSIVPPGERKRSRPATRTDYTALHQLATEVELYRAQSLGRLRRHPGQRTYQHVTVGRRLAELGRLDTNCCVLCHRDLDGDESIAVGRIDGETLPLLACSPACPTPKNQDLG